MPEKSVRKMNKLERLHHSLASRTFRATLMGAIVLGLSAMLIGLGWYTFSYCREAIIQSFSVAKNAQTIILRLTDPVPLCDEVLTKYRTLTDGKSFRRRVSRNIPPNMRRWSSAMITPS